LWTRCGLVAGCRRCRFVALEGYQVEIVQGADPLGGHVLLLTQVEHELKVLA
jgi:hypothetical protein